MAEGSCGLTWAGHGCCSLWGWYSGTGLSRRCSLLSNLGLCSGRSEGGVDWCGPRRLRLDLHLWLRLSLRLHLLLLLLLLLLLMRLRLLLLLMHLLLHLHLVLLWLLGRRWLLLLHLVLL